jgi:hypothetical protein
MLVSSRFPTKEVEMSVYELSLTLSAAELAERLGCQINELDDHDDEELWGLIRDFGTVVGYDEKAAAMREP